MKCVAIDLFCGIGGLTYGIRQTGIDVAAGIDIDSTCRYAYEENNKSVFINKGIEEVHLLRSIFQYITDHILQHFLCHCHIIIQICKCHFRLDHPELCGMARCVGVFGAESRSESIDIAECLRKSLSVQLSAYCQVGRFFKEVLGKIYFSVFCLRNVVQVHGGYLEHLSGSFTVTSCDQRCVYIDKASLLEKLMDGKCNHGAHPEHCLKGVGAWTQMRNGP